jgi:hypothetical protein
MNAKFESIKSFEQLSKVVTLEDVLRALKAMETSKEAHKAYYNRRKSILAQAKAMGIKA